MPFSDTANTPKVLLAKTTSFLNIQGLRCFRLVCKDWCKVHSDAYSGKNQISASVNELDVTLADEKNVLAATKALDLLAQELPENFADFDDAKQTKWRDIRKRQHYTGACILMNLHDGKMKDGKPDDEVDGIKEEWTSLYLCGAFLQARGAIANGDAAKKYLAEAWEYYNKYEKEQNYLKPVFVHNLCNISINFFRLGYDSLFAERTFRWKSARGSQILPAALTISLEDEAVVRYKEWGKKVLTALANAGDDAAAKLLSPDEDKKKTNAKLIVSSQRSIPVLACG